MGTKRRGFWGYYGENPLGFGLPWAKFTWWVWAIMGTKHPRVWATIEKIRSVWGYHGQCLLGFGRLWAKFFWVWATTAKVYLGLGYYGHGRL